MVSSIPSSRLIALGALIPLLLRSHLVSAQSIPPLGGGALDAQAEMGMSTIAELPGGSAPASNAQTSTVDPSVAAAEPTAAAGNTSVPTEQPPTPDYESLMEPFYLFRQRFLGTDCPNHKADPAFYACCHPLPAGGTADPSCFYWPQDDDPCEEGDKDCLCEDDGADEGDEEQ